MLATLWFPYNPHHKPIKSLSLGTKCVFKHRELQMFGLKLSKCEYVYPLEVVGRGNETQLIGGEYLNIIM